MTPVRCGILTDQSLTLRRRRNDHDALVFSDDGGSSFEALDAYKADDIVPQIYACATMWHETRTEMTQLLKSIFRYSIASYSIRNSHSKQGLCYILALLIVLLKKTLKSIFRLRYFQITKWTYKQCREST